MKRNKESFEIAEYIQSIKHNVPCTDCKKIYPYWVMDFDHITGKKLFNISQYQSKTHTLEMIKKEVSKCEVVCSNCHRERTYRRMAESKSRKAS
jgi:hypothetical protein